MPPIAAQNLDSHQYWDVLQQRLPGVDTLIERASSTMDQHARANLYLRVQRIHHDDALACPGVRLKLNYAASPSCTG